MVHDIDAHARSSPFGELRGDDEVRGYTAERLAEHIAEFSLAAVGLTDIKTEIAR